jgi:hypothetical protein
VNLRHVGPTATIIGHDTAAIVGTWLRELTVVHRRQLDAVCAQTRLAGGFGAGRRAHVHRRGLDHL